MLVIILKQHALKFERNIANKKPCEHATLALVFFCLLGFGLVSEGCNPGQTLEAQGVVLHDEIRSLVVRDALVSLGLQGNLNFRRFFETPENIKT